MSSAQLATCAAFTAAAARQCTEDSRRPASSMSRSVGLIVDKQLQSASAVQNFFVPHLSHFAMACSSLRMAMLWLVHATTCFTTSKVLKSTAAGEVHTKSQYQFVFWVRKSCLHSFCIAKPPSTTSSASISFTWNIITNCPKRCAMLQHTRKIRRI